MASGLDALVDFLAERTALSGDHGARKSTIKPWIDDFYRSRQPENPDQPPPNLDAAFVDTAWSWLVADDGIICQKAPVVPAHDDNVQSNEPDQTSVEDVLTVSEERAWLAITGHGIDHKRLPPASFQLLSIIASHASLGIYQPELVAASGQDKRSVPQRTDFLDKHGYITKRRVTWKRQATSWLVLKKLAPASGDISTFDSRINESTAKTRPAGAIARDVVEFLTSNGADKMVTAQALRESLGVVAQRLERQLLNQVLIHMSQLGWIKVYYSRKANGMNIMAGVAVIRIPQANEVEGFEVSYWKQDVPRDLAASRIQMTQHGEEDDALFSPHMINSEEVPMTEDPSPVICASWRPEYRLEPQAFDLIAETRFPGLDSTELGNRLGLNFAKKTQEVLLTRITANWPTMQPPHLRHFSIVRDVTLRWRAQVFIYRTFESQARAVASGDTMWPAVGCKNINQLKQPNLDEWGFKPISKNELVSNDAPVSMSTAFKANWKHIAKPSALRSYRRHNGTLQSPKKQLTSADLDNRIQKGGASKTRQDRTADAPAAAQEEAIATRPGLTVESNSDEKIRETGDEQEAIFELADLRKRLPKQPQWQLYAERAKRFARYIVNKENRQKKKRSADDADAGDEQQAKRKKTGTTTDNKRQLPEDTATDVQEPAKKQKTSQQSGVKQVDTARRARAEIDYLMLNGPGCYINPPTRLLHQRGRPKQRLVAVIKSEKLKSLPWYLSTKDKQSPAPIQSSRMSGSVSLGGRPSEDVEDSSVSRLPPGITESSQGLEAATTKQHPRTDRQAKQHTTQPQIEAASATKSGPSGSPAVPFSLNSRKAPMRSRARPATSTPQPTLVGGGTLGMQRRDMIYFMVQRNGGVYPGDREISTPFAVEWKRRYGKPNISPDTATPMNAMKYMVQQGTLKRHYFTVPNPNGVTRTKSIVIIPGTKDEEEKVKVLQEEIIHRFPSQYIPEDHGLLSNIKRLQDQSADTPEQTAVAKELQELQKEVRHQRWMEGRKRKGFNGALPAPIAAAAVDAGGVSVRTGFEIANFDRHFAQEWKEVVEQSQATLHDFRVPDYKHDPQAIYRAMESDQLSEPSAHKTPSGSLLRSDDASAAFTEDVTETSAQAAGEDYLDPQLRRELLELAGDYPSPPSVDRHSPEAPPPSKRRRLNNPVSLPHPLDALRELHKMESMNGLDYMPSNIRAMKDGKFITVAMATPSTPELNKHLGSSFAQIWSADDRAYYNVDGQKCRMETTERSYIIYVHDPWRKKDVPLRYNKKRLDAREENRRRQVGRPRTTENLGHRKTWLFPQKPLKSVAITEREAYELIGCVVVVRTLTDSSLANLDWRRVAFCLSKGRKNVSNDHATETRKKFEVVLKHKSIHVAAIQRSFESWFLTAYSKGQVPPVDFDRLDEYNWNLVCDLTFQQIPAWIIPSSKELPATRAGFNELYVATPEPKAPQPCPLKANFNTMHGKRTALESLSSSVPFWPHKDADMEEAERQTPEERVLTRAISLSRAAVMTPDDMWNLDDAKSKVLSFPPPVVDAALRVLEDRNITRRKNKRNEIEGRNLIPNPKYEKTFADHNFVRFRRLYADALTFKRHLDKCFDPGNETASYDLYYHIKDGEALVLVELLMNGEVEMDVLLPPSTTDLARFFDMRQDQAKHAQIDAKRRMSVWGFGAQDYKKMHIDQANLTFPLRIRPTATYSPGTYTRGIPTLPQIPLKLDGPARGMYPLWASIHDEPIQKDWFLALGSVAFMHTFRAGIAPAAMRRMMGERSLTESEIRAVASWLAEAGLSRPLPGGGTVVRPGWWRIVAEALAEGSERGVHEVTVSEPPRRAGRPRVSWRVDALRNEAVQAPRRRHRPSASKGKKAATSKKS